MGANAASHVITGTVTYADSGDPVPGIRVELWDDDLLDDDSLGSATTDEEGRYRIAFDSDMYHDLVFDRLSRIVEGSPELYLEVKDDAGTTLASTSDSVVRNPGEEEVIDVEISRQTAGEGGPPVPGDPTTTIERYDLDTAQFEELTPETMFTVARSLEDPSAEPGAFERIEQLNADLAADLRRPDPNTRRVERVFNRIAAEKGWPEPRRRELETVLADWWMDHRRHCGSVPVELGEDREDSTATVHQPLPSAAGESWESVALFFNFESARPDQYQKTAVGDAREWLDEGSDPADITVSEFVRRYYDALSYGEHPIDGVDTPRDSEGDPLVPTIDVDGDAPGWGDVTKAVLQEVAEDAWEAAGRVHTDDGTRWIPSVVLVQNYDTWASAWYTGFEITVDGTEYAVGDYTHIEYSTSWHGNTNYRGFWDTLCHEYAHNFVQFTDLYGPNGAMIYWDMLGDGSGPGNMSEITSIHKEQAPGWNYSIDDVVDGSTEAGYTSTHTLEPFTTSGDALKIVPDPEHNPYEYFVVEYRTSTGQEVWRPDGGLSESGLFIAHVNERFEQLTGTAVPNHWGNTDSPYIDAELADFEDEGKPGRSTKYSLEGTLFNGDPNWDNFGPGTQPSSDFYGGRSSTLSIYNLTVADDEASFTVSLDAIPHRRLWTVSADDRGLTGRFTTADPDDPAEVFLRDDDSAALLVPREGQWFVKQRQAGWIDGWNLGGNDREYVGDLDGDGRDEVFIRSDNWAGVVQWADHRFEIETKTNGSVGRWDLTGDMVLEEPERAVVADLDGDGQDEILIRGDDRVGVVALTDSGLAVESVQQDTVGEFSLSFRDVHEVGRFSDDDRDEIMVNGDDGLAILRWDDATNQLDTVTAHGDAVDSWELNTQSTYAVTDLDDDGRDEIYVRRKVTSPAINEAGVFDWNGSEFELAWSRLRNIKHLDDEDTTLSLGSADRSYAGDFFPGTDSRGGILHVANDRVSFLSWKDDTDEMRVRYEDKGGWFTWENETKLLIDDFQDTGPETVADKEYIADHTASAFLHNTWGTGQLSMDFEHTGLDISGKPGITWLQPEYLVGLHEPSVMVTLHTEEPILDTEQAVLSATPRGVDDAEDWSIEWFDDIPDEGASLGTTDPGETITWDDLPSVDSTIVYATATNGQEELEGYVKISIRKRQDSYVRDSAPAKSGYVMDDGTVVTADTTDELIVGDDENDVGSHALLSFDLSTLPDDVDPDDIQSASLDIILSPPEGTPYADLLDLSVVHVDYGESIDPQDYRTKDLTFRPGRSVVEYDGENNWGTRSIDVAEAVRDAVNNRSRLGETVQFAIYHRTATDNDSVADYTRVESEHENNSAHHSRIRIEYDNTPD